ncbi:MAG: hypothetical protein JXK07_12145 [Spirochaetes bacterium]|nr:hypothetical protein [Spirochaetota bacterium]MBN2770407.1 hypothetical protein [Spirochaetota bacterium]
MNTKYLYLLPLGLLLLFFFCCDRYNDKSEIRYIYSIHEGISNFIADYEELSEPKGILPTTLDIGKGDTNIILKMPNEYFEYFAFDSKTSLVILSYNPFVYINIQSPKISAQLNLEFKQFKNNVYLSADGKKPSQSFFYDAYDKVQVAVAFTPTQIQTVDDEDNGFRVISLIEDGIEDNPAGKILDCNHTVIYTPTYEDEGINNLITYMHKNGKSPFLYTTKSDIYPPQYHEVDFNLNFSFMAFSNKKNTDETLSLKDFDQVILFSSPFGNKDKPYDKDYLNSFHGLAVIIKGDTANIMEFLSSKGIDFINKPPFTNKMNAKINDDRTTINLEWLYDGNYRIDHRRGIGNPDKYPPDLYPDKHWHDTDWITIGDNITGTNFEHNGLEAGFNHYFRLTDLNSGESLMCNYVIGKVATEQTMTDPEGEFSGTLAITEINLVGSVALEPDDNRKKLDAWFEVKNVSDYIITLKDVDFYYRKESDPFDENNILFGPNHPFAGENPLKNAVDANIYPGEYYVITRYKKYLFSGLIMDNISQRSFLEGVDIKPVTNDDDAEGENLPRIQLVYTNPASEHVVLSETVYTGQITSEYKNGVRTSKSRSNVWGRRLQAHTNFQMMLSESPFAYINPFSNFSQLNSASPGKSESAGREY